MESEVTFPPFPRCPTIVTYVQLLSHPLLIALIKWRNKFNHLSIYHIYHPRSKFKEEFRHFHSFRARRTFLISINHSEWGKQYACFFLSIQKTPLCRAYLITPMLWILFAPSSNAIAIHTNAAAAHMLFCSQNTIHVSLTLFSSFNFPPQIAKHLRSAAFSSAMAFDDISLICYLPNVSKRHTAPP